MWTKETLTAEIARLSAVLDAWPDQTRRMGGYGRAYRYRARLITMLARY
jgi:hypothetical protein